LLRGYNYDRESSEFTIYHLKQALKLIGSCPEVNKVHIIGHSRGTDVVSSALRELHLEIGGTKGDDKATRSALKLGTVVLAAPDMDLDVTIQRLTTARVGQVPERFVIYVHTGDKALGLANWLFSGATRLGEVKSDMFSPAEIQALRANTKLEIIDARLKDAGAIGHDYFHSNPAVSSDLILLMRYQFPPGAAFGRPLGINKSGFWLIEDNYPGAQKNELTEAK
jgi:esterase/lipase superfamily enzyme